MPNLLQTAKKRTKNSMCCMYFVQHVVCHIDHIGFFEYLFALNLNFSHLSTNFLTFYYSIYFVFLFVVMASMLNSNGKLCHLKRQQVSLYLFQGSFSQFVVVVVVFEIELNLAHL